jgi:beta-lactamase superfamily II metal-dependent hydrolase
VLFYLSFRSTDKLSVTFVDVGQGDGIIIKTPSNRVFEIDGGPNKVIEKTLFHTVSALTKRVDVLLATHPDADHITGLVSVLKDFDVKMVVESPAKGKSGVFDSLESEVEDEYKSGGDRHTGNLGDVIDFGDGVTFTIVSPATDTWHGEETNDESVTGVLRYGEYTFLLTGDLPSTREGAVIASGLVPRNITVLKAGHHGSKYSSSDVFLNYLKPTYSIISAGKNNRYGHPNPEAMERLQKNSKVIMSTIDHGSITFVTDGRNIEIVSSK